MTQCDWRFDLAPVLTTRTDVGCEVVKGFAGVRPFNLRGFLFSFGRIVVWVLVGNEVNRLVAVHAMLGDGQPRPPRWFVSLVLVADDVFELFATFAVFSLDEDGLEA